MEQPKASQPTAQIKVGQVPLSKGSKKDLSQRSGFQQEASWRRRPSRSAFRNFDHTSPAGLAAVFSSFAEAAQGCLLQSEVTDCCPRSTCCKYVLAAISRPTSLPMRSVPSREGAIASRCLAYRASGMSDCIAAGRSQWAYVAASQFRHQPSKLADFHRQVSTNPRAKGVLWVNLHGSYVHSMHITGFCVPLSYRPASR